MEELMEKPQLGEFCWNELATTNIKAAKSFYGEVFGWEFVDHPIGDMTYTMVRMNNKEIAGIWAIPADQTQEIPPHWMSYILVDNVEKTLEKARQQGATIVKGSTQVGDFGRLAIMTDPTGASIALWQSAQK